MLGVDGRLGYARHGLFPVSATSHNHSLKQRNGGKRNQFCAWNHNARITAAPPAKDQNP